MVRATPEPEITPESVRTLLAESSIAELVTTMSFTRPETLAKA